MGSVVADRAGRGLRVELVRVVEHCRLGGARRLAVVVAGDGMEQLGEGTPFERGCALLDHAHAQVHMAEQSSFLGLGEDGAGTELAR